LTDGTGIAAPLSTATARLKESKAKRRVIVLFTDGDNNIDISVTPRQAAKLAAMFDVKVYTVGIGRRNARQAILVDLPDGRQAIRFASFASQVQSCGQGFRIRRRFFSGWSRQSAARLGSHFFGRLGNQSLSRLRSHFRDFVDFVCHNSLIVY